jgi:hypothetical protein
MMRGKRAGNKLWPLILAVVIVYVAALLLFIYTSPVGPH